MMPWTSRSRRKPSPKLASAAAASHSWPPSIQPTGASDQANTAWNMMKNKSDEDGEPCHRVEHDAVDAAA